MKILVIFLLSFIFHVVVSQTTTAKPTKSTETKTKPTVKIEDQSFTKDVIDLFKKIATANKYEDDQFAKCHIVPWAFIKSMIIKGFQKPPGANLTSFIDDLAKIHVDAKYYKRLTKDVKDEINKLTETYKKNANNLPIEEFEKNPLAEELYNFPSNLYPCDKHINKFIGDNLDSPKKENGEGVRLDIATEQAKYLYRNYKDFGLTIKIEPDTGKVYSSDRPPDDYNNFVTFK